MPPSYGPARCFVREMSSAKRQDLFLATCKETYDKDKKLYTRLAITVSVQKLIPYEACYSGKQRSKVGHVPCLQTRDSHTKRQQTNKHGNEATQGFVTSRCTSRVRLFDRLAAARRKTNFSRVRG